MCNKISFEIEIAEEETREIPTTSFYHGSDVCVNGEDAAIYLSSKGIPLWPWCL